MPPYFTLVLLGMFAQFPDAQASGCSVMREETIEILDESGLQPGTLQAAFREASWLLRSLCVIPTFTQLEGSAWSQVRILPKPRTNEFPSHVMGFALPRLGKGNRAAVFLNRVRDLVARYPGIVSLDLLLGMVLAHEIGHLLIHSTTHSNDGLLRAQFGKTELLLLQQRRLLFTAADRIAAANVAQLRQ